MYFKNASWNPILHLFLRSGRLRFVKIFNIVVPYQGAYHLNVTKVNNVVYKTGRMKENWEFLWYFIYS
jgi:hypothetical protein